ncbi:hypothetical protein HanIR_Chr04g0200951 [Helianthus annuus]|nr:hypothetical protein HanIR_Chr04g0200951 [Helianthus annuus]
MVVKELTLDIAPNRIRLCLRFFPVKKTKLGQNKSVNQTNEVMKRKLKADSRVMSVQTTIMTSPNTPAIIPENCQSG